MKGAAPPNNPLHRTGLALRARPFLASLGTGERGSFGRCEMSPQTIATDLWKAILPEDWTRKSPESEEVLYFEAPDGTAGVYFSAWRIHDRSLRAALQDTLVIEWRNLPGTSVGWEMLARADEERDSILDITTKYYNRDSKYLILSRLLGSADRYVRLTYHDYDCGDPIVGGDKSRHIVESLDLHVMT